MSRRITTFFLLILVLFAPPIALAKKTPKSNFRFELSGVQGAAKENITKRLEIIQKSYPTPLSERDINAIYAKAPEEIREAMKPYGFFKALINTNLTHVKDQWVAHYDIFEGPIMPITRVNIQVTGDGENSETLKKLIDDFPIKNGDRFILSKYESARNDLLNAAEQHGYIYAKYTHDEIVIDMTTYSAKIIFHLDTGKQYRFGDIIFHSKVYSDAFLKCFLTIKSGDIYSSDKLVALQESLARSVFFSSAAIDPNTNDVNNVDVPITINTKPSSARKYRYGIGYGTYTELRGSIELTYRHLTDSGHYARIFLNGSAIQAGITAQYVIPGSKPLTDQLIIGAQKKRETPNTGFTDLTNASLNYLWAINRWNFKIGSAYQFESYRVTDEDAVERTNFFMPEFNMGYDGADHPFNPTKGFTLNLNVRGADEALLSDTSFTQETLTGRFLIPISINNRALLRGKIGVTQTSDLDNLPLSIRYKTGGIGSLRGFSYDDIGPGQYTKELSLELQHRVTGGLYIAAFADTGIAADEVSHSMEKSVGPALVYQSPFGSISISYAKAITKDGQPWRLEFNIGTTL